MWMQPALQLSVPPNVQFVISLLGITPWDGTKQNLNNLK